jgi:hypothetical protein
MLEDVDKILASFELELDVESDVLLALMRAQGGLQEANRLLEHEIVWKPRIEAVKAGRNA